MNHMQSERVTSRTCSLIKYRRSGRERKIDEMIKINC